MHDRAEDFGRCLHALLQDRGRPGASAIFDEALTNALAEIVATRWPGRELRGDGKTKAARPLLAEIRVCGRRIAEGVYELEDIDPPPHVADVFGLPLEPTPTIVSASILEDAIDVTQPVRHGRAHQRREIIAEHIEALEALNADRSLRVTLDGFDLEEHEQAVALADSVERSRARAYVSTLSIDEWERREAVDYEAEYTEIEDHERFPPYDCPACGLQSLIASGFDTYLGEVPWGVCVACSYTNPFELADLEGRDAAIDRAIARDD